MRLIAQLLDSHVRACAEDGTTAGDPFVDGGETALRTWERLLVGGGRVQRFLDRAYVLSDMLDALYGKSDGDSVQLLDVPKEHWALETDLVLRVGEIMLRHSSHC